MQPQLFPWLHALPAATAPFPWLAVEPVRGMPSQPALGRHGDARRSPLLLLFLALPLGDKDIPKGQFVFEGLQVAKGSRAPSLCRAIASYGDAAELGHLSACNVLQPGMSRSSHPLSSQAELNFICLAIVLARPVRVAGYSW